jgi:hypothetical protein
VYFEDRKNSGVLRPLVFCWLSLLFLYGQMKIFVSFYTINISGLRGVPNFPYRNDHLPLGKWTLSKFCLGTTGSDSLRKAA